MLLQNNQQKSNSEIDEFLFIMDEMHELNRPADLDFYTSPHDVSVTKNPSEETIEQMRKTQEKFLTLPEPIQDKLVSYETTKKIQHIGKGLDLEPLQMADIARAVRGYYFGELKQEDLAPVLSREMKVDIETAQKATDFLVREIINDNSQEKAYQAQFEQLSIESAIKKYPTIGGQLITADHIKLSQVAEPVRPSINNWLADYTFVVGIENHDQLVRSNYLFRSENGRTLSAADREKLTAIIRSFEEDTPLTINSKTGQVVFQLPEPKSSSGTKESGNPLENIDLKQVSEARLAVSVEPAANIINLKKPVSEKINTDDQPNNPPAPKPFLSKSVYAIPPSPIAADHQRFPENIPDHDKRYTQQMEKTAPKAAAIPTPTPARQNIQAAPPAEQPVPSTTERSVLIAPKQASPAGKERISGGMISFSSPQKLSAEKDAAPEKNRLSDQKPNRPRPFARTAKSQSQQEKPLRDMLHVSRETYPIEQSPQEKAPAPAKKGDSIPPVVKDRLSGWRKDLSKSDTPAKTAAPNPPTPAASPLSLRQNRTATDSIKPKSEPSLRDRLSQIKTVQPGPMAKNVVNLKEE